MRTEMRIEAEVYLKREKQKAVLYITDDLREVRRLLAEGKAAAALLTQDNRREDFSGILYALEKPEELGEEELERIYRRLAGLPWNILETKRCWLREMTEADLDALYGIYAEKSVTRYMEGLFEDPEEERRYITDYRRYVYEFYEYGMWLAEEKESGYVIGRVGFEPQEDGCELGYVIGKAWQKKGYALELCTAAIEYMRRTQEHLEEIVSRVHRENTASKKLLERLGFQKTGEEGEMERWTKDAICSMIKDSKNVGGRI